MPVLTARFPGSTARFPVLTARFASPTARLPVLTARFPGATARFLVSTARFPGATARLPGSVIRFPVLTARFPGLVIRFLLPSVRGSGYAAAVSNLNPEVAMRRSEYEMRKSALEAELKADIELLRAASLAKLRALERLWLAAAEDLPAELPPAVRESPRPSETPGSETVSVSETLHPDPPASPPVLRRGQVMDDLMGGFHALPEEFEKRDVFRLLGYEPPRATMYRVLSDLIGEKWVEITLYSEGHRPTRYRKLPQPPDDE